MTDEELAYLETCDLVNNEGARKLVAEVRRLQDEFDGARIFQLAHAKSIERWAQAEDALFGASIEIDNLRKMLADWKQKAEHNLEVAEQYRKDFEAADDRARIHQIQAVEAIKERNALIAVLTKIREARYSGCSTGEAMSKIECWAREAITRAAPPPVPMCSDPHPLEKLIDEVIDNQNPT